MKRFCTNCGAELEENDNFCPMCGSAVEEDISSANNSAPVSKRKQKVGIIIVAVVLALVVAVAGLACTIVFLNKDKVKEKTEQNSASQTDTIDETEKKEETNITEPAFQDESTDISVSEFMQIFSGSWWGDDSEYPTIVEFNDNKYYFGQYGSEIYEDGSIKSVKKDGNKYTITVDAHYIGDPETETQEKSYEFNCISSDTIKISDTTFKRYGNNFEDAEQNFLDSHPSLKQNAATSYKVKTKGDDLNMRSSNNITATVIARIPNETVITVTQVVDNWGYTTYNGKAGWVSMDYLVLA